MAKSLKNRFLNPDFFDDLSKGHISDLLEIVQKDHTLDLQIRHNQMHIYYRGGKIMDIKPNNPQDYDCKFDYHYFLDKYDQRKTVFKILLAPLTRNFRAFIPLAKQVMDTYFAKKKMSEEREFQQLIVRTNNYSGIANATDYYIVDIEYAKSYDGLKSRFDLVALEWKSESSKRSSKSKYKPHLMIIEMKYGEGALSGRAGLNKHYDDITKFISNDTLKHDFISEMECLFLQKIKLGLIPSLTRLHELEDPVKFADTIDVAYLISDHDPASKRLNRELQQLKNSNAKFITANFTGYGMFTQNVFDFNEFSKRFTIQIG
jgi:hypothetical protein